MRSRSGTAPPRSWRRGRSLRHAKFRLATPQRGAGAGRAISAPTDATLAHLKVVLHFPRPRQKRLPFVEDGLKTRILAPVEDRLEAHILAPIERLNALLQPLAHSLGHGRRSRPSAPLARTLNLSADLLVHILEDRRPARREPLP